MTRASDADAAATALLQRMGAAGCQPLAIDMRALLAGRLVRFRAEGDKPGRLNGWARLTPSGAVFGNWRLGVSERVRLCDRPSRASRAERERVEAIERAHSAMMARERAAGWDNARAAAVRLWEGAGAASPRQPYLVAKCMTPEGLRQAGELLLVPMHAVADGALWNVQRIGPDGRKRFLPGGRVKGLAWGRGQPEGLVALCEGVATAAAVHAATGRCAIAAFTKAELAPAAAALRARFPAVRLVLAADADPDGGGEAAARAAAEAVGGRVALPPRPATWNAPGWDYADLWTAGQADAIRAALAIGGGR